MDLNSNTTLVKVKFNMEIGKECCMEIQIQHLLKLNIFTSPLIFWACDSNTTLVKVKLLDWYKKFHDVSTFKYNTC